MSSKEIFGQRRKRTNRACNSSWQADVKKYSNYFMVLLPVLGDAEGHAGILLEFKTFVFTD